MNGKMLARPLLIAAALAAIATVAKSEGEGGITFNETVSRLSGVTSATA